MIREIELKLIDDKGNYSIAHIDYKGYMNMIFNHDIDLVKDALEGMIVDYKVNNRMEIDIKKYPCVNHDAASWDEEEANKRMDVIGQNGNEGIHYVTNEEADEDATEQVPLEILQAEQLRQWEEERGTEDYYNDIQPKQKRSGNKK